MKIYIANYESNRIGGGWTFANNFAKGIGGRLAEYEQADVYFIPSASMVNRSNVEQAKKDGKKIVLRIDNALRNSRNRNTGMSRMKDFADWADLIVYQSSWARDYLSPFTKKEGIVILNGIDLESFYPEEKIKYSVIYSRQNRDETKNWEVARYWFSQNSENAKLYIVGNFSPELVESNFDFYMDESYEFLPTLPHDKYAKLLRRMESFLYTYYNDACSNSLIEALCAGCKIVGDPYYRNTGGGVEIQYYYSVKGRNYFSLERMVKEYLGAFESS